MNLTLIHCTCGNTSGIRRGEGETEAHSVKVTFVTDSERKGGRQIHQEVREGEREEVREGQNLPLIVWAQQ